MSAYVVVDIDVTDPAGYEEYRRLAPATIAAHGGRYLVRGGPVDVLEGEWTPRRFVVLEFDDVERARAWSNSPEYQRLRAMRRAWASANMVLAQGTDAPNP
jgi:uncharacterized protein (DUF1330 family)